MRGVLWSVVNCEQVVNCGQKKRLKTLFLAVFSIIKMETPEGASTWHCHPKLHHCCFFSHRVVSITYVTTNILKKIAYSKFFSKKIGFPKKSYPRTKKKIWKMQTLLFRMPPCGGWLCAASTAQSAISWRGRFTKCCCASVFQSSAPKIMVACRAGWIRTNDLRVMSPTSYRCYTAQIYFAKILILLSKKQISYTLVVETWFALKIKSGLNSV